MTRRQKEHAQRMRERRHAGPRRPWDYVKAASEDRFRLSLRRLIDAGMTDSVIAQRLGIDKQTVWFLRNAGCLKPQ